MIAMCGRSKNRVPGGEKAFMGKAVSDPHPRQPACTPWPGGHRRGIIINISAYMHILHQLLHIAGAGDWGNPHDGRSLLLPGGGGGGRPGPELN